METLSDWSTMRTSGAGGDASLAGTSICTHTHPHHLYKVGVYGWRKRLLYLFIVILMVMVIINTALLVWIIRVMDFSTDGMGKLRILDTGVRLEGEAQFLQSIYTSKIESRKEMALRLESSRNVTLNARNEQGEITNRLVVGESTVEAMAKQFIVKNQRGRTLFTATDNEIEIAAEGLRVSGSGGVAFKGSVQTPLVSAEAGSQLRLESPTRTLNLEAPHGIALESKAGDISAACLRDLKLQSTEGGIKLDAGSISFRNLPEAATVPNKAQTSSGGVFQLCACENGRLFLALPNGNCVGETVTCK